MSTFPFPILVAGPGPAPEIIDHCPCGIHRAHCTYHATPIPSNPKPLYTIRIKGQHYAYSFSRAYTSTLDKVRSLEMKVKSLVTSGVYTNVTISITCDL